MSNNTVTVFLGYGYFKNVEFYRCGQELYNEEHDHGASLSFLGTGTSTENRMTLVEDCAFTKGLFTQLYIAGSNNISILNNNVFHSLDSGKKLKYLNLMINILTVNISTICSSLYISGLWCFLGKNLTQHLPKTRLCPVWPPPSYCVNIKCQYININIIKCKIPNT